MIIRLSFTFCIFTTVAALPDQILEILAKKMHCNNASGLQKEYRVTTLPRIVRGFKAFKVCNGYSATYFVLDKEDVAAEAYTSSSIMDSDVQYLRILDVNKKYQNKGLGSELLKYILSQCRFPTCERTTLIAIPESAEKTESLHNFYRRHGGIMQPIEQSPHAYFNFPSARK